ncbi:MAG: DUF1015 family protein [Planctomycetota bacterium]
MLKIYPFRALIPSKAHAPSVACPPYDVLSIDEAQSIANQSPESFVHVIRPEVDPSIEDPHSKTAYEAAKRQLDDTVQSGQLVEHEPAIYLYRQAAEDHVQTGIVCCYDVQQYRDGLIKKHETTRPDKEDDRVEHMLACNAHPEPVLLTFRSNDQVDQLIDTGTQSDPIFSFKAGDGVQHTGWKVDSGDAFVDAFSKIEAGYIADGHHRTAAADRVAKQVSNDQATEADRVLSVWFPSDQLRILAYNRIARRPDGVTVSHILQQLATVGELVKTDNPTPSKAGQVCIYCDGTWHSLRFAAELISESDLINSLDVAILQEHVLAPIFGIDDPRTDPDIEFVGGSKGTLALQTAVDSGQADFAFSMFPTSLDSLITVSDQGDVMPPKSTWFDPKLRSGLFVHRFDS